VSVREDSQVDAADEEPRHRNPVALTVTAVVLVVVCLLLSHWQLTRVRRPIDGYAGEPAAVPLDTLVPAGARVPHSAQARLVTLTGHYLAAGQRVLPGHQVSGAGVASWVVTPLQLPDGSTVAVVRGFVVTPSATLTAVPTGTVAITGRIQGGDPGVAVHATRSGYVVRTAQSPPDPLSLQPVPTSPPGNTAPVVFHLQNAIYVVQWFVLAVVMVVFWYRLMVADRRARAAGVSSVA